MTNKTKRQTIFNQSMKECLISRLAKHILLIPPLQTRCKYLSKVLLKIVILTTREWFTAQKLWSRSGAIFGTCSHWREIMKLRKEQILGGKIDLQHDFLPTEDHIFSHWCWSFCQKKTEMTHKCGRARPIYLFEPTAEKCNFQPFCLTTGPISKLKVSANTMSFWMLHSDSWLYH